MNRWTHFASGLAVALSIGAFAAPASANLLIAPGFEPGEGAPDAGAVSGDPATTNTYGVGQGNPWIGYNIWTGFGYYTDAVAHNGSQSGKTFSPNGGLYQVFNVNAGETYLGSAWFLNNPNDALAGDQFNDVRLVFQDSGGGTLATIVSPTVMTAATPQGEWVQLSVTGTAPVGATRLQFMLKTTSTLGGGGALFADDASLTLVPEPASLALLGSAGLLLLRRRSA